jgi:hypothetical protein
MHRCSHSQASDSPLPHMRNELYKVARECFSIICGVPPQAADVSTSKEESLIYWELKHAEHASVFDVSVPLVIIDVM